MNKTFFANCYLEFTLGDKREGLIALVSEQGALRIQFHGVPYSKISGLAGKVVDVLICGKVRVRGKLSKEINPGGAFYRLQFENLDEPARATIRETVAMQSYPAPWERKTARFPSNSHEAVPAAAYEQPRDAVLTRKDMLYDLRVVDYSRDGVLLEGNGSVFAEWHAGERVEFNLCTNAENNLKGLSGVIVRISEDYDRELNEIICRFGIQFAQLDESTRRNYQALIANAEREANLAEAA